MKGGAAFGCFRAPGGTPAAAIVVIGSLWLAASTASAQSGSPYLPVGYVQTTQSTGTYVAPTLPAQPMTTYTPRTTSIRELWIPGLVGLPVAWVATWVNASLSFSAGSEGVNTAFIPIAGPWLVLASQHADVGYYVTTGLVQDISLICLVLGLVIRVPEPSARIALGDTPATLRVSATPTATGGAFSASLQF